MTATVILLILGAQALLIPCGHCRPQATFSDLHYPLETLQMLTMGSIDKRQITIGMCTRSELQNIFANYPQDCTSGLSMSDLSSILNQQNVVSTLIAAYRIICQPRCGNPLITFYNRCGLPLYGTVLRGLCGRNDAGMLCYEGLQTILLDTAQATGSCIRRSSACTSDCRNSLTNFENNNGCCLNAFNSTVFGSNSVFLSIYEYDLWSNCGVNTPGFCDLQTSSLSAAERPYFVRVLFLLTLIVTVVLLF